MKKCLIRSKVINQTPKNTHSRNLHWKIIFFPSFSFSPLFICTRGLSLSTFFSAVDKSVQNDERDRFGAEQEEEEAKKEEERKNNYDEISLVSLALPCLMNFGFFIHNFYIFWLINS